MAMTGMIIYLVAKRLIATERVDAFHMKMFHGEGRRACLDDGESCDHKPGDDLSDPILYTCNAFHTPDIAMPALNFMVSARIQSSLSGLPGLGFGKVILEKVIDLPYSAGDFSFYDRADFRRDPPRHDFKNIFRRWKDRPDLHAVVGPRFEVVTSVETELAASYPEAKLVDLPDPCGDADPTPTPMSERMITENSLVGTMTGTAVVAEAFHKIDRFLDRDYFAVAEVLIG